MQLSMEQLVEIVVKEVLAELARRGMVPGLRTVESPGTQAAGSPSRVIVDMTGYRTPVLTENRVRAVERHVSELVVPAGTEKNEAHVCREQSLGGITQWLEELRWDLSKPGGTRGRSTPSTR